MKRMLLGFLLLGISGILQGAQTVPSFKAILDEMSQLITVNKSKLSQYDERTQASAKTELKKILAMRQQVFDLATKGGSPNLERAQELLQQAQIIAGGMGNIFSAQASVTSVQSLKKEIAELIKQAQALGADKDILNEQLTSAGDDVAQLQGLKAMMQDTIGELKKGSREREEKAKKERMAYESRTREIADLVRQIENRLSVVPKSNFVDIVRQEYAKIDKNDPEALRDILAMLEVFKKPAEPSRTEAPAGAGAAEPERKYKMAQVATEESGAGVGALKARAEKIKKDVGREHERISQEVAFSARYQNDPHQWKVLMIGARDGIKAILDNYENLMPEEIVKRYDEKDAAYINKKSREVTDIMSALPEMNMNR